MNSEIEKVLLLIAGLLCSPIRRRRIRFGKVEVRFNGLCKRSEGNFDPTSFPNTPVTTKSPLGQSVVVRLNKARNITDSINRWKRKRTSI